jgi:hypothetical protein
MANLCKNEQLIGEIMNDVRTLFASNGLKSFETVSAVYLESEPFSVENGLMTPTFKLKWQQMALTFRSSSMNCIVRLLLFLVNYNGSENSNLLPFIRLPVTHLHCISKERKK